MLDRLAELSETRFTDSYCFDCECVLRKAWYVSEGLCDTCIRHRAITEDVEGRTPVPHTPASIRKAFCHGAGPDGKKAQRMGVKPRALFWEDTIASKYRT